MHARTPLSGDPIGKPNFCFLKYVVVLEVAVWSA